jgi:hypothetical protein
MLWSDGTDGPTIDVLLRRQRPRPPRTIDELFAGGTAAFTTRQLYSVVLHPLVIAAAVWLGAASFGRLT